MKLEIKTVKKIIEDYKGFIIPSYQRGYRWRGENINNLIEDIKSSPEGYFLQVLILKENRDKDLFDIVDGQQRLTTILKMLGKDNLIKAERNEIDNYFFNKIAKADDEFAKKLLDTSFLVYEVDEDLSGEELFRRLNIGKIPLSSAELIKAKIITDCKKTEERRVISQRWDALEKVLLNDDFFFYFCPDSGCSRYNATRMDYLLELLIAEDENDIKFEESFEKNSIFVFNKLSGLEKSADKMLSELESLLHDYQSIYLDIERYNAFGFYLYNKKADIKTVINGRDKKVSELYEHSSFQNIKDLDYEKKKEAIEKLDYGNDKDAIKKTLLMYNCKKYTENKIRFDFIRYKNTKYDIEHIHARNEEALSISEIKNLIKETLDYIDGKKLPTDDDYEKIKAEWNEIDFEKKDYQGAMSFLNKLNEYAEKSDLEKSDLNKIGNLTLLPERINKSISNHIFNIKCQMVKEQSSKFFVPEFTMRIYESEESSWTKKLSEEYKTDIIKAVQGDEYV